MIKVCIVHCWVALFNARQIGCRALDMFKWISNMMEVKKYFSTIHILCAYIADISLFRSIHKLEVARFLVLCLHMHSNGFSWLFSLYSSYRSSTHSTVSSISSLAFELYAQRFRSVAFFDFFQIFPCLHSINSAALYIIRLFAD